MTFQAAPGEWKDYVVSDYVLQTMGMITGEERNAYGHYARRAARENAGIGIIIDGGSYIGASTLAFAEGLLRSGRPLAEISGIIHSYDLFVATQGMIDLYPFGEPIRAGDDFSPIFQRNLGHFAPCVVTHKGNIKTAMAPSEPVRICFADVIWDWEACACFMTEFATRCVADQSILIHQDFVYPLYPWLPLTMGVNTDVFSFVEEIRYSTAVFNVVNDPRQLRTLTPTELSFGEASAIFESYATRLSRFGQGCMFISNAVYALTLGLPLEARAIFSTVVRDYGDEPLVSQYFATVDEAVTAGELRPGGRYWAAN